MVGGIEAGDVVIVAGRPSTGRTSLVTSIGGRWALKDRKDVVFVSLQHTGEQIATRLLAGVGKIEHTRLRTGQLDDDDWPKLTNAVGTVVEAPFFIEDDPIQTPEMIERLIENHVKARGQIGLLVIDPLEGISEFQGDCRFLRRLAKTIKVPIIATVAVSADVERRPNKRPLITDLPADLKLDQLADKILFLYRDEMYYPEAGERDTAELIVARNIHGPLGSVRLRFDSEHLVFRNVK
jgi:replicative DNA helicase